MTVTAAAENKAVQVGVGVMIMHQGKVLVGKRIGSHGAGESEEETGLVLDPASTTFVVANNNIMSDIGRHYVTVFIAANVQGNNAKARIMEPLKCERWEWINQEQLLNDEGPYRPLFSPLAKMVRDHDLTSLFQASSAAAGAATVAV
ncbi:Nudix hydrolase 15, mitochondrial [Podila humilis]|nr:Nudix hydrolase 15, mitochondrial [Podila humilis]